MVSRSYRPSLNMLENRVQPGSMLSSGLDMSMLGSSLLANSLLSPALTDSSLLAQKAISQVSSSQSTPAVDLGTLTTGAQPLALNLDSPVSQGTAGLNLVPPQGATLASPGSIGVHQLGGNGQHPLIPGDTLWYSGDFDGVNGLANEENTLVTDARTYDNFTISDPNGWDVDTLFSHNLMSFYNRPADGANWEIRTGVSSGNGGTLVGHDTGVPDTQTFTTGEGFGFIEFETAVPVAVHLDPGTYWLNVVPVGHGTGRSFNSTTSGLNGIGSALDHKSFWDSTTFGQNFAPAAGALGLSQADFSVGVGGVVTGAVGGHGGHHIDGQPL
jgi:hypothetical protein